MGGLSAEITKAQQLLQREGRCSKPEEVWGTREAKTGKDFGGGEKIEKEMEC